MRRFVVWWWWWSGVMWQWQGLKTRLKPIFLCKSVCIDISSVKKKKKKRTHTTGGKKKKAIGLKRQCNHCLGPFKKPLSLVALKNPACCCCCCCRHGGGGGGATTVLMQWGVGVVVVLIKLTLTSIFLKTQRKKYSFGPVFVVSSPHQCTW